MYYEEPSEADLEFCVKFPKHVTIDLCDKKKKPRTMNSAKNLKVQLIKIKSHLHLQWPEGD